MDNNLSRHNAAEDEGLLAVDAAMGIMGSNPAAERILGMVLPPGERFRPERAWNEPDLMRVRQAIQETLAPDRAADQISLPRLLTSIHGEQMTCTLQPLFDSPDTVIGVILSLQRVTRRSNRSHTALYQVRRDQERLQNQYDPLLEALPEGVFTINTHWHIESFNKRAEEITGYRREEVIGRHCWEIFRSDLCQLGCPLRTALESGLTSTDQDVRILKKGGKRQTILVNAGVLRTSTGKIRGAVETFRPLAGEAYFSDNQGKETGFAEIIGRSPAMQRIFEMLPDIAASDANVLITGESGTGKDLIARTLHDLSSRRAKPLVAVNCSALAESLLESELFGHEKAAFTGATGTKIGRFELARGGTLFLDEIGELKAELQIKLLRVLENHEFERVGGTRTLPMECRIISATNKDLRQAIGSGQFREDFYYRLRTVPVSIPPLRERLDDLPLLVEFFLKKFNLRYGKRIMSVHSEVMQMFLRYHWPGNVRELERTLEHAYVFVKGPVILAPHLPAAEEFQVTPSAPTKIVTNTSSGPNRESIQWALLQAKGNRNEAAKLLGMSRTTLWRHMKQLGLE